jgi:hypothetical protein
MISLEFFLSDPGKTQLRVVENFAHYPKGLFLYQARKSVPGPAGVLSYHAWERNLLSKARSRKFRGRFRAGE